MLSIISIFYYEQCNSCQIAESSINCEFKTNNKMNLLETLKQLFLAIDKLQTKNLGSLPHKVVDFNKFFSHLCLIPANLTRLLMIIYFGTISTIESFFNPEMELESISKLYPIFFNCAPDFTLQINNQTVTECIIELYPTQIYSYS